MYQLQLQDETVAGLARKEGVRRQTIYQVWTAPYPRMEKVLADALDMRPQDLFPERYDADGLPTRRRGLRPQRTDKTVEPTTTQRGRNVRGQEAA
jgi:Ner family transcriptional regulator